MTADSFHHLQLLSAVLFGCGLFCVAAKRNAISVLMGIELILNAANLNFIAAARYHVAFALEGIIFVIMVIVLAAAEAAVALAIMLNFYNNRGSIDVDDANLLEG